MAKMANHAVTESSLDDGFASGVPVPSPLQSIEWLIGVWECLRFDDAAVSIEFRPYMPEMLYRPDVCGQRQGDSKAVWVTKVNPCPFQAQANSSWHVPGDGSVSQADMIAKKRGILIESKGAFSDAAEVREPTSSISR